MKILIFTKNWLGDVIFETPAIKVIKQNFPEAKLIAVCTPRCEEILRKNPNINDVILFDEKLNRTLREKWSLVKRIRREKIDRAYLFHRSFSRALITFLGGAKERIGYATKGRGFLLTKAVTDDDPEKHQVYYFLDLLKRSGHKVDIDPYYEFFYSPEDDRRAGTLLSDKGLNLSNLVALNPGANRTNKRWRPHQFARLTELLVEKYQCSIILTGNMQDDALASEIMQGTHRGRPVSLCGNTRLGELGAVFSRCKLVISGDSGPLHIAAGVGANVMALFGPTEARLFGPFGRGKNVVIQSEVSGQHAMKSIEPSRVMEIIEREKLL